MPSWIIPSVIGAWLLVLAALIWVGSAKGGRR